MTVLPYSRSNPSPRHQQLAAYYATMHAEGHAFVTPNGEQWVTPDAAFRGRELLTHTAEIKTLIERFGAKSILDYGSGKGEQYASHVSVNGQTFTSPADYWGTDPVTLFEPAIPAFSVLPEGQFDGVVTTDVLEHLSRADVPWIVEEMFEKARHFVFANVACYPAGARLPSGENAHEIVASGNWWNGVFETVSARYPAVSYVLLASDGYNRGGTRFVGGGRT